MNQKKQISLLPIFYNETYMNLIAYWRNTPEVKKTLRSYKDISFDKQKSWTENVVNSDDIYFYIMESEKNEHDLQNKPKYINTLLGYCGLDKIHLANRTAEISLLINPRLHGQGYGSMAVKLLLDKAFNEYNLELIHAETYFSKDFWTKCGFKNEATLRDRKYYENKYHDSFVLSIKKKEFKN